MKRFTIIKYFTIFILLFGFIIFKLSNVSKEVTAEDKVYIQKILDKCHLKLTSKPKDFKAEIDQIFMVQDSILKYFPVSNNLQGISINNEREPKDILNYYNLLCFDRARTMEKIFISLGYDIKHVFIISDTLLKTPEKLSIFIKNSKSVISHSVFEIKTINGWMVVGTNEQWCSVDKTYKIYDCKKINSIYKINSKLNWLKYNENLEKNYFSNGFQYLYGLYSRHGKFYPPYNLIPDINYLEFSKNIKN